MKPSERRLNTISIIPGRKHGRPAGNRIITRPTTVRPFVYGLPVSKPSQRKTKKTDSSIDSFYLSTPVESASSRRKRNVNRSLLKSFSESQGTGGKDTPKTVNTDMKDSFRNSIANMPVSTENLSSRNTISPPKMSPHISTMSPSRSDDHEEVVIATRKKNSPPTDTETSFVAKQKRGLGLNCTTYSAEKKIERKRNSHSHETLQEKSPSIKSLVRTEIQPFDQLSSKKISGDPEIQPSVPLSTVPIISLQGHPLKSTTVEEFNFQVENSEITVAAKLINQSSIISQQTPLIGKTSTPVKLKQNKDSDKSSLQISSIVSSSTSTAEVEGNHSLTEPTHVNKERDSDISDRGEAIDISRESAQHIKLKKCTVVLEYLQGIANWKCPVKETQEASDSTEEEEEGNDEAPSRSEKETETEHHLVQPKSSERNITQEENDAIDGEYLIGENKVAAQGGTVVTPTKSPKSSTLNAGKTISPTNESNKDTDHEPLSLSSVIAKTPDMHSSSDKSLPQVKIPPDHVQNGISEIRISDSLAELQSVKHSKPSEHSSATKRSASETNEHPQFALLDADIEEPVIIAPKEPLIFQGKELCHPSNGHLTYTAATSNIRKALSKQPKKSRHKRRLDCHVTKASDRRPLFEGRKKIKLWKGKTGNRKISDICDLDIALNVIEEVIKELSEEAENKQELLHQIQKKCEDALHQMMLTAHGVQRRSKEAKQLMETVKGLADELDDTVDKKIRLQGMLLKSKAKKITEAEGPTWKDFSKF